MRTNDDILINLDEYLTEKLHYWRHVRNNVDVDSEEMIIAESYLDALRGIRMAAFGEIQAKEEDLTEYRPEANDGRTV